MPRFSKLLPWLAALLFLPATAMAQKYPLEYVITGLEPSAGTVEISLFNSEDSFMVEAYKQRKEAVVDSDTMEGFFGGLKEGRYALVVVQDANDNGKLDNGFLGFGGEGYGFSNNARPLFGWPSFEEVSVEVGPGGLTVVEIELH